MNWSLPSRELVTRKVGTETILVPVSSSMAEMDSVFTFNELGAFLWQGLQDAGDAGVSEAQLVEKVIANYDVASDVATEDVRQFFVTLSELDLAKPQIDE